NKLCYINKMYISINKSSSYTEQETDSSHNFFFFWGQIHLPVISVNGISWPAWLAVSPSSLKDKGMDGQTKAGTSTGTIGGSSSPTRTFKIVLMEGLSCGFG
ncbi:hypothetical protein TorRG33x02_329050, partial [Trema orientale]